MKWSARALVVVVALATGSSAVADEAGNKAVKARLEKQKVNLNFDDTPFDDALGLLHDLTGVAFVIDAEARSLLDEESPKVRLQVRDITVRSALQLVLACNPELAFEPCDGTILVYAKDKKSPAVALPGPAKKVAGPKVTVSFDETPLAEVAAFLETTAKVKLGVADDVKDRKLTLRVKDLPLESLLTAVCRALAVEVAAEGDALVLRAGPKAEANPAGAAKSAGDAKNAAVEKKLRDQKVTLDFDDTPLSEVVKFLQDLTGLSFVVDAKVDPEKTKVTMQCQDVPAKDALDKIAAKAGCRPEVVDGAVVLRKK